MPIPSQALRGTLALGIIYAAFIAEVFRAGIQSISTGQREAGRSIGLSERQIMRFVVLPQAIRNIMPALGNDLIALLKDSSLVSIIAVRELTQMTRLYTGSSFRFMEGFLVLTGFYLVLTVGLSLLLRWYERRIAIPGY
jgi:polar amino acid transport system permease protein